MQRGGHIIDKLHPLLSTLWCKGQIDLLLLQRPLLPRALSRQQCQIAKLSLSISDSCLEHRTQVAFLLLQRVFPLRPLLPRGPFGQWCQVVRLSVSLPGQLPLQKCVVRLPLFMESLSAEASTLQSLPRQQFQVVRLSVSLLSSAVLSIGHSQASSGFKESLFCLRLFLCNSECATHR